MAKTCKSTETLLIQLEALCTSNDQRNQYNDIRSEHNIYQKVDKQAKGDGQRLYRALHATRMLDTSLRLFLDIHSCRTGCSIGEYLKDLSKNHTDRSLLQLNGTLAKRFITKIANPRNKFMHTSNQFPQEKEVNELISSIRECLQTVLNLRVTSTH